MKPKLSEELEKAAEQYILLYNHLLTKMSNIAAVAVLQEIARDRREEMRLAEPATAKQKAYLRDLKIVFKEGITKRDASVLIDEFTKKGNVQP